MDLLALDEVQNRLKITGQSDGGLIEVEVSKIVGSVDRSTDFNREFDPVRPASRPRLDALRSAFAEAEIPPVDLYELGGVYFVSDGHHRIALAIEREMHFMDARVTRIQTNYELPEDVSLAQLIHTHQRERLMEESGLAESRPQAAIEFARPRGYPELLETIKSHGYDMARHDGDRLPPRADIAASWFDNVYSPGLEAVRKAGLPEAYPVKTEADLFLWIYERRRDLRVENPDADFDAAASHALDEGLRRKDRKVIENEKADGLRPRDP
jgi:hypothetical protein